jgi:uncharacterized membrane protein (UPF0127 family)
MPLKTSRLLLYIRLTLGTPFLVLLGGDMARLSELPLSAQAKLSTLRLITGSKEIVAELAITPWQRAIGLMFRTSVGPDDGMLFVYGKPDKRSYWMKNCSIPLSIAYIGPDGTILEIHDLEPDDTRSVASHSDHVQYALETQRGWFAANGVGEGAVITTEMGALGKTLLVGSMITRDNESGSKMRRREASAVASRNAR